MNSSLLDSLSREHQIAPDSLVAEEYEILILHEIFEHEMSHKMVFKGGTALRLAYLSRRFSEDLDFSMIKKGSESEFQDMCDRIVRNVPNLKIQFAREKYYCYFGRFQIKDPNLPKTWGVKLEISKRPTKWIENKDFKNMDFISPTVPFRLTGPVVDLSHVFKDKRQALKKRVKGRDLYDWWWLCQHFGKKFSFDKKRFPKPILEQELHRFLGKSDWRVIDSWFI